MASITAKDFAWVSMFDDRVEAEKAVDDLKQAGFDPADIRFAIRGEDDVQGGMITDAEGIKDKPGALYGMLIGALIGAVIGVVGGFLIPSYGTSLTEGVLATLIGCAVVGVAIGGIFGAMMGLRVSEREAEDNQKIFHSGRAIVSIHGEGAVKATEILHRHGGYDIHSESVDPIHSSMKP
jgi:hypothetical protein